MPFVTFYLVGHYLQPLSNYLLQILHVSSLHPIQDTPDFLLHSCGYLRELLSYLELI
jgi:hypothetical protein